MATPKKIQATVAEVIRHSDTVIGYSFTPEGRMPLFKPGQFLHLALDPYDPSQGWPESRVFSLANAPQSSAIRIVISVKGSYTARMAAELKEGMTVWLKFPYGNFTFDNPGNNLVLIAGGTGISPYISFLEHCLLSGRSPSVSLFYGIREDRFLIFGPLLQRCKENLPGFRYTVFCEDPGHKIPGALTGILDIHRIVDESSAGSGFYLSGPPAMIENFKKILIQRGIPVDRIFVDEW